jgi:hypothetical protein
MVRLLGTGAGRDYGRTLSISRYPVHYAMLYSAQTLLLKGCL